MAAFTTRRSTPGRGDERRITPHDRRRPHQLRVAAAAEKLVAVGVCGRWPRSTLKKVRPRRSMFLRRSRPGIDSGLKRRRRADDLEEQTEMCIRSGDQ